MHLEYTSNREDNSDRKALHIMKNNACLNCFPVHKSLPDITLSKADQLLKEGEEFEVTCTIRDVDSTLWANWIFQGNAVFVPLHPLQEDFALRKYASGGS
ncbi:hypothetical protein JD844_027132 [Phrynosoma platyrhinos]|uniref:Ig-like domain-containing protein n=1 Tax=Phrynosoma platyrhinos TaxID=52577 RepID=A0ABQ7SG03_PHRPL|nr:hypothetical protein JD844_027132 [Phrynosoma platyrhinos]